MLPEQKDLIYKHFPQLVQECNLEKICNFLITKKDLKPDFLEEFSQQHDYLHKNRLILFKLIKLEDYNSFPGLIEGLRHVNNAYLANSLENKLEDITENNNLHPLDVTVDVKFSQQFYDTEQFNKTAFYPTRSKNRGHVLLINNIKFSKGLDERHGADVDEKNLRELFEIMGLKVFSHTNLDAYNMIDRAKEFAQGQDSPLERPDMAIVVIMSHGMVLKEETMIFGSDNKYVAEDYFRVMFNNENCPLFIRKPKIFIYHVCRTVFKKPPINEGTMTDAILGSLRTYSDMLICHPSVKGFAAHRNSVMGSWYIQMLCKVFMEHAHEMDIESLLRKVDEELEKISALPWELENAGGSANTQQTSTFQNIAFKKCYLHPGLYEENGSVQHFAQSG